MAISSLKQRLVLLWTNSSPTASFNAQKVGFTATEYDFFLIFYYSAGGGETLSTIVRKNEKAGLPFLYVSSTYDYITALRDVTIDDSGATFTICSRANYGTSGTAHGQTDNTYCIPTKIYGIRI